MCDRTIETRPTFFFNDGEEDREAYLLLRALRINCNFAGPTSEEPTPLLISNYREYRGLDEIRRYIEEYKK